MKIQTDFALLDFALDYKQNYNWTFLLHGRFITKTPKVIAEKYKKHMSQFVYLAERIVCRLMRLDDNMKMQETIEWKTKQRASQ